MNELFATIQKFFTDDEWYFLAIGQPTHSANDLPGKEWQMDMLCPGARRTAYILLLFRLSGECTGRQTTYTGRISDPCQLRIESREF